MSERVSYEGVHRAKAVEWDLDVQNGKECVVVRFEFADGPHTGRSIQWWGYFTEAAVDRTMESLRYCGWDSDSIAELDNLGANEVELVVKDEEYQGKWRSKVQWVNRLSRLFTSSPMDAQQRAAFAARMRGKAVASRQKLGTRPSAAPAHATQQRQPARAAYGGGGGWDSSAPSPDDDDIPF